MGHGGDLYPVPHFFDCEKDQTAPYVPHCLSQYMKRCTYRTQYAISISTSWRELDVPTYDARMRFPSCALDTEASGVSS